MSPAARTAARPYQGLWAGVGKSIVIPLKGDDQDSIALAHNPVFHSRTKHIDIQHHYIRDEVAAQRIQLSYIPTDKMIADGLTKALTHVKFHRFIEQMNMQSIVSTVTINKASTNLSPSTATKPFVKAYQLQLGQFVQKCNKNRFHLVRMPFGAETYFLLAYLVVGGCWYSTHAVDLNGLYY